MRVVGVNVKGGKLLLAVVDEADGDTLASPVSGTSTRVQPNDGLDDAQRLADLKDRVVEEFSAAGVEVAALVATRAYSGWKYKEAFSRVMAISAVMLASVELQMRYVAVPTSRIAKVVGAPASDLRTVDPYRFGFSSPPTYWTTGLAEAFAVGATVLAEQGAD